MGSQTKRLCRFFFLYFKSNACGLVKNYVSYKVKIYAVHISSKSLSQQELIFSSSSLQHGRSPSYLEIKTRQLGGVEIRSAILLHLLSRCKLPPPGITGLLSARFFLLLLLLVLECHRVSSEFELFTLDSRNPR